jgi:hypothetical protein
MEAGGSVVALLNTLTEKGFDFHECAIIRRGKTSNMMTIVFFIAAQLLITELFHHPSKCFQFFFHETEAIPDKLF